jgi:hypothetical protein
MKYYKVLLCLFCSLNLGVNTLWADNQTVNVSPILPESKLPFSIVVEKANFNLPQGIHSGVMGIYDGLWIFIGGSHLGLHGFGPNPFPPNGQNKNIYVVNPVNGVTVSRSLLDRHSGLTQQQIDSLSTISAQFYQKSNTLYVSGGYGYDTSSGAFNTKPIFTAINLPGIVKWVMESGNRTHTVNGSIRQIYNPIFQIAGGGMFQLGDATRIIFGQNFRGVYTPGRNGDYSKQIRQFQIVDKGGELAVHTLNPIPSDLDPNYRRRDLNIMPVLLNNQNKLRYGLVAYSGVFTETNGVWTVPVVINEQGVPSMADPHLSTTFKQGMNNYISASVGVYSRKYMSMYNIFFGGISYGFFSNGVFQRDGEIPFINQVTTIQMDKNNQFTQYLMKGQYPVIPSTGANPGNPLLFGAGAYFITNNIQKYPNNVLSLDGIRTPTVIGYIVGGIQSTVPNTSSDADTSASTYIFKVTLVPKRGLNILKSKP